MSITAPPKKLGHEYINAEEASITATMVQEFEAQVSRMYTDKKMLRQVHTKMHGCVKAGFIVAENLPNELKVGVFSKARHYNAWVRFSNGSTEPQKDKKKDVRGIAIKLLGVEGEKLLNDEYALTTQDFLLMSSETFFTRTIQELSSLLTAFTSAGFLKKLLYFLNPLHWIVLMRVMASRVYCDNPLNIPYWSTQPYQFGTINRAVKYHLMPSPENTIVIENTKEDNYLRINLAQTLYDHEAKFDFFVQFQTDATTMPIEDPTVPWTSQYIKLATLVIYPQTFDSNKQMEFGDNLSFSPWHSLPAHRPLGSFNRVRRRVYEVMSKFRHEANEIPLAEPKDSDHFLADIRKASGNKTIDQKIPTTKILQTSAQATIRCTKEEAFKYIASSEKLSDWLTKVGPIHGIEKVELVSTHYSKVGDKRKATRGDKATFTEELISVHPYANYAYQISNFSDFFKYLTEKAYGCLWFDTIDDKTRVTWVYAFTYKNIFGRLFLALFVPLFLKKYLQKGLNNAKEYIED